MSRAFVKETNDEDAACELPERPLSAHPNYVTPRGLEQLNARLKALRMLRDRLVVADDPLAKQKVLEVGRDIRYFKAQLERAQLVAPGNQPRDEVHFGARVTLADETGKEFVFYIVGDDEADVASGRISWASPLAGALLGARVGDCVKWSRLTGDSDLEIRGVNYSGGDPAR